MKNVKLIVIIMFIISVMLRFTYSAECGNGICEPPEENVFNCFQDCGYIHYCGDGICDPDEDYITCPEDCDPIHYCGNGICDPDETWETCPEDCSKPHYCGDGHCDEDEDIFTCPEDCGYPECYPGDIQNVTCDTGLPGICSSGYRYRECIDGYWSDWSTCKALINPGDYPEDCDNGLDDDCDGYTDSEDSDCWECTPGSLDNVSCDTGLPGICSSGYRYRECIDGYWSDWSTCKALINPGDYPEDCDNGLDDDCDGYTDSEDSDCWFQAEKSWLKIDRISVIPIGSQDIKPGSEVILFIKITNKAPVTLKGIKYMVTGINLPVYIKRGRDTLAPDESTSKILRIQIPKNIEPSYHKYGLRIAVSNDLTRRIKIVPLIIK